ncbi:EamA family transporter [Siphonobacter sp. SORGH_AS_1065]|uniref:EamA family transporter n=1 Tax=Siphonobacter sp. SORGH_AS_1065 TaxID=3041795 RepID=UPI00277E8090|nr:EamA family transporter [Siphonobacter sp. SORGH_AS_1065]MDQ1087735.1 transporter family protein [Siphonobacter sp. SORGH_AS_1065]
MWIVFALLAALSAACVVVLSKVGIKNVDSSVAFAIQSILIIIVAWSVVAWQGNLVEVTRIERKSWVFLIAAGILTCFSSLLSFRALKLGDAGQVSPITNLSFLLALILGIIFLKEKINWVVIAGAILMAIGGVMIATARQS